MREAVAAAQQATGAHAAEAAAAAAAEADRRCEAAQVGS